MLLSQKGTKHITPRYHPDFCIRANTLSTITVPDRRSLLKKLVEPRRSGANFICAPAASAFSLDGDSLKTVLCENYFPLHCVYQYIITQKNKISTFF